MRARLFEVTVSISLVAGCITALSGPAAAAPSGSRAGSEAVAPCKIFPANNIWHADISRAPVHRLSAAYVASIGATRRAHPDFGSGLWQGAPFGIPVTPVRAGQRKVPVSFYYADESDRGPYPIPYNARIEGGPNATGDRHVILYDRPNCKVYEMYDAHPLRGGAWRAGSGAVFDLRGNRLRPAGWTSADAAGLSIFAGLVRYDEVARGRVDHAIRMTAPRTQKAYVWPARHHASNLTDPRLPPMGQRFRLKASVDISRFPPQARVIAIALKKHGAILADNGSSWYLTGNQDTGWDNDQLSALKTLRGSDFEAVDVSRLMLDPNSAAVRR